MRIASALAALLIIAILLGAAHASGAPGRVSAQVPTATPSPTATPVAVLPPTRFWGNLTLNGAPAPTGTTVTAVIDGQDCGSRVTTTDGQYWVDALSSEEVPGCGTDSARVAFRVNSTLLTQGASWLAGHFVELNLTSQGTPP